jgi:hypothetical protein
MGLAYWPLALAIVTAGADEHARIGEQTRAHQQPQRRGDVVGFHRGIFREGIYRVGAGEGGVTGDGGIVDDAGKIAVVVVSVALQGITDLIEIVGAGGAAAGFAQRT